MLPPLNLKSMSYLFAVVVSTMFIVYILTLPEKFRDQGRTEVRQQYAEEIKRAMLERSREIDRVKREHEDINKQVVSDYESKINTLDEHVRELKSRGLRVPKTICKGIAANSEATSAQGSDETESIRLPERIENDLYSFARRAQEVNIQLGACQAWIAENGFYKQSK